MDIWLLRVAWVSLPLTAGPAAADALAPWGTAPREVGEVLLWVLWAVVLVSVLAPQPLSLTAARTGIPLAFVAAAFAVLSGRPSTVAAIGALSVTVITFVLVALPGFSRACAQGAAYGDEERFPLKVPPVLFLGILPIAVLAVGAGLATGPLLLAAERWVLGALAVLVGFPIAWVLLRSLHQLARRWVVLVPAGLVVADPMTLSDPVLFIREHIEGVGPADPGRRPPEEAEDLRLGAASGSVAILLDEEFELSRRARDRSRGVRTHLLLVATVQSRTLLQRAEARRIRVRT